MLETALVTVNQTEFSRKKVYKSPKRSTKVFVSSFRLPFLNAAPADGDALAAVRCYLALCRSIVDRNEPRIQPRLIPRTYIDPE
jgi:hypothetical protein